MIKNVFCEMALLHPRSPLCLLPVGSAVLMSDCSGSSSGLREKRVFGERGCMGACVCTQRIACEPPPSESSFSFLSRQTHSEVQKSLLSNRKRASSNLSLHQSVVFPLGKGHLERRYESDSILELTQKAKQLIYYAATL